VITVTGDCLVSYKKMNEHPGIRPVIVKPEVASVRPVRSLPFGAKDMPVGLSANSVGLGTGQGISMRRILFTGIPLTILIAVAVGTWLFARSLAPLAPKALVNGSYQYDFLFYKNSELVNLVAGQGLKYGNQAIVIAKTTTDDVVSECKQMNTKKQQWKEAFRTEVMGVERPVCRLNDNVYVMTFYGGSETKHLLEISYTSPHTANTDDVRKITSSLKVTLE